MSGTLTVGVDVGGTKIAAGVVDDAGQIVARRDRPTPTGSADELVEAIASVITTLTASHPVDGVGVGVAGLIDPGSAVVRSASHLPLHGVAVAERLTDVVGRPVTVDNDVNVGGIAELQLGAARGFDNAVLVAVGTGIGGALIVDSRVQRGWTGAAGEIGHMIVERGGRPCPCGSHGCWEQYASGRALMRAAADAGMRVNHGFAVTMAATAGDERARGVLTEIGGWLGLGIANLVAVLDPELVVVGGGVSAAGDFVMTPTLAAFRENLTARAWRPEPPVVTAAFGPDAGLIGASLLARDSAKLA